MTVLGAGGSSVSSTGGAPSRPVDLWAPSAGPPIQGKSRPARRTPATTIVDSSLSSVPIALGRSIAPSPSKRPTPQQETGRSTTFPPPAEEAPPPTGNRPVHNLPRRQFPGSGGEFGREIVPVQHDQCAHRPRQ